MARLLRFCLCDRRMVLAVANATDGGNQRLFAEMIDGPLVNRVEPVPQFVKRIKPNLAGAGGCLRQHHPGPQPGVVFGIKAPVRNVVDLHVAGERGGMLGEPRVERRGDEQMAARRRARRVGTTAGCALMTASRRAAWAVP